MIIYPTKYESCRTHNLRGVVFTKYNYIENAWKSKSHNPHKNCRINWWDDMINYRYTSLPIILPNMNDNGPTILEELHWQRIA
jgi:hypothetical protein